MNEIIKGMANAAEAIQENFEEQGEKITAVEQNIDLLSQKAVAGQQTVKTTNAQVYVEFMLNYPDGHTYENTTVTASPVTLVGSAGIVLYQVSMYASQVRLRLRTFDNSTIPADTDVTIQYQFVRIDSGD